MEPIDVTELRLQWTALRDEDLSRSVELELGSCHPSFTSLTRTKTGSVRTHTTALKVGDTMTDYHPPAQTAHSLAYWLLIGWWWAPIKWLGRVALWLLFWPVGLWRSIVHGRNTRDAKTRRGYR